MNENDNKQKQVENFASANLQLASVAGQVGCLTLVIVFIGLVLGRYLDQLFGTKPVLLIIFVLGSGPIALFLTYKIAINATRKANLELKKQKEQQQEEGETSE